MARRKPWLWIVNIVNVDFGIGDTYRTPRGSLVAELTTHVRFTYRSRPDALGPSEQAVPLSVLALQERGRILKARWLAWRCLN